MYINIKKIRALGRIESARIEIFGEAEIARLDKIKNEGRRRESASALLALAELAQGKPDMRIKREESGRPCFESGEGDASLTHSGTLCAAALTESGRVGVDIERIDEKRRTAAVAERFFSDSEKKLIAEAREPHVEFFKLWTVKEAAAKCRGTSLVESFSDASLFDGLFTSTMSVESDGEKYILSVATTNDNDIKILADDDIVFKF